MKRMESFELYSPNSEILHRSIKENQSSKALCRKKTSTLMQGINYILDLGMKFINKKSYPKITMNVKIHKLIPLKDLSNTHPSTVSKAK